MPPLPPMANTLKTAWQFDFQSAYKGGFDLHFLYAGGPPSATDLNNIGVAMGTAWDTNFSSFLSTAYSLESILLTDLTSATSAQALAATVHAGTDASGTIPINCAAVMNHKIGRRYRGGKPRTYLPIGSSSSQNDAHTWTAGFQTAVDAAWNSLINTILGIAEGTTQLQEFVNVSYYSGFTNVPYGNPTRYRKVPTLRVDNVPPNPIPPDTITSSSLQILIGSQRRRTKGTGS